MEFLKIMKGVFKELWEEYELCFNLAYVALSVVSCTLLAVYFSMYNAMIVTVLLAILAQLLIYIKSEDFDIDAITACAIGCVVAWLFDVLVHYRYPL